jgi:hypothetical protein
MQPMAVTDAEKNGRKRPESDRPKMPRSQRAKQFAPFDALTGLSERLRRAEEEHRHALESGGMVHVRNDEGQMEEDGYQ